MPERIVLPTPDWTGTSLGREIVLPGATECILPNQYDVAPDQKFSVGSAIVLGREFTLQTRF
jgi:hypothetical protein